MFEVLSVGKMAQRDGEERGGNHAGANGEDLRGEVSEENGERDPLGMPHGLTRGNFEIGRIEIAGWAGYLRAVLGRKTGLTWGGRGATASVYNSGAN